MDFSATCRICLTEIQSFNLKSLLLECFDNFTYGEMVAFCTGIIMVDSNKKYPSKICITCEELLLKAYKFKQLVSKADKQLNDMLTELENSTESMIIKVEPITNEDYKDTESGSDDSHNSETLINTTSECLNYTNTTENNKKSTRKILKKDKKISNSCTPCNLLFDNLEELKEHRKVSHPRKRSRKLCLICGKLTNKANHADTHKDISERKTFECTICNRTYVFKHNLKQHLRIHANEYPYECQYCNKKFKDCSHRRYHVNSEHTGETKFTCDICGRKFIQSSNFKQHMLTHTGERPFKCELCDKSFNRPLNLKYHMATHSKERNFKCDICGKEFSLKKYKVQHMKIHTSTDERNFTCPVCAQSFMQNHILRSHIAKKHPDYILPMLTTNTITEPNKTIATVQQ